MIYIPSIFPKGNANPVHNVVLTSIRRRFNVMDVDIFAQKKQQYKSFLIWVRRFFYGPGHPALWPTMHERMIFSTIYFIYPCKLCKTIFFEINLILIKNLPTFCKINVIQFF